MPDGLAHRECAAQKFDYIERIDRLTTIAENRRSSALQEIERRRAVLGESLRRSVQEIEDGEFEVRDVGALSSHKPPGH